MTYDTRERALEYLHRQNQDPVALEEGKVPLLGIDMWEHAYYIQYKNDKARYLDNIWKVVNWKNVEERYKNAVESLPKM